MRVHNDGPLPRFDAHPVTTRRCTCGLRTEVSIDNRRREMGCEATPAKRRQWGGVTPPGTPRARTRRAERAGGQPTQVTASTPLTPHTHTRHTATRGEQLELSASRRRPAASPTQLSAGRRRASIAPRAQRLAGTPQCRRLQLHHARGSSGAPRPGSGGTITTAASPMRHELALPARLPCAPQQRGVEACAAALHAFERRTSFCCGWVVGWVTARKKIVGRLPRIWGSIFRDS